MVPVSIFGSCVTRDVLSLGSHGENIFDLKTYIARQSVFSAISPPVEFDECEIKLESDFQKKCVAMDLSKQNFGIFKDDGSKFLLIDFIDDRYDLIEYQGSIITASYEFLRSNFLQGKNYKKIERQKSFTEPSAYSPGGGGELFKRAMDAFISKILESYAPQNVILHKAFMRGYYRDKNGELCIFPQTKLNANAWMNTLIGAMYLYIERNIPGIHVVGTTKFAADENNKWGLAAMHYEGAYYSYVYKQIEKAVNNEPVFNEFQNRAFNSIEGLNNLPLLGAPLDSHTLLSKLKRALKNIVRNSKCLSRLLRKLQNCLMKKSKKL